MGDFEEYLSLLKIRGLNNGWIYRIKRLLVNYLDYTDWDINKNNTLEYLKHVQEKSKTSSFRKHVYQIRKYLTYLGMGWAKEIVPPAEPMYCAKHITKENIQQTIHYFKSKKYAIQLKAIIMLGATSGLRAEELYQLNPKDIDIGKRIIHVNHNPRDGQSTKTKRSRISFFNEETEESLIAYLTYFDNNTCLKSLFSKSHLQRCFHYAPIHVKDLRKFFSQEWDRQGGPTTIKKILMGHSLKGDVDLMHYNYQSEEDLKKIYGKVGIRIGIG